MIVVRLSDIAVLTERPVSPREPAEKACRAGEERLRKQTNLIRYELVKSSAKLRKEMETGKQSRFRLVCVGQGMPEPSFAVVLHMSAF
jgi:hypothetical protein